MLEGYYNEYPVEDLGYLTDMGNTFATTNAEFGGVPVVGEAVVVASTPWYASVGAKLAMIGGGIFGTVAVAKSNKESDDKSNDDGHQSDTQIDLSPEPTPTPEPTPAPSTTPEILTATVAINDVDTVTQKSLDKDVVLSGTFEVSDPTATAQITLTINGTPHQASIRGTTWTLTLDGQTLAHAQGTQPLVATINAIDTADQNATNTAQATYLVDTHVDMPVISFDPIAQDDIINLIESQAPTTLITGAVQNVSDGEILTLAIGKSVATAEIIDGKFSVLVDTVALVNHKTIDATITARDEHDNTATATLSKSVSVQTEIATPTITLDDIAGDNVINKEESEQDTITISGKVTDVPAGQDVLVACYCSTCASVNWKEIYAKVKENGEFSVDFSTIDLVRTGNNTIKTTVTVVDNANNTATASTEKTYSVDTDAPAPTIQIGNVTDDNLINQDDSTQTGATVSVLVNDLGVDDVVTSVVLMVNGTSYTATKTADPNTYTADVSMTDLVNDTQIVAHVTAQDKAGNVATVNGEKAYDVNLSAPQVAIKLDPIANDNIIDETERTGDSDGNIIITGRATGDYNDQDDVVVSLGNSTYPTKLTAQGTFSVAIPADTLTKDSTKSITATLSTKNSVGNTATVSDTVGYAVQSNELQITIDPITADNLINESEATGEIVITGSVSGADRLLNQPVTLTIGGRNFETTANADGVFELPISASVLKDVPTYTIVATATGQNNAKASTNLAYKVSANVAAQIDITNIDGNFGLSVAQEESIVRIGGQFEFDGVFGKGMNDMHVRHVSVKIGDKTYYSGLDRGKFFFDVPFDELQALNGQSLSYEFIHNPNAKLYDLTDLGGGAYQITDSNTNWQINADGKNTATIKEVTIDSPYLTKGADGNYSVAVSDEPMSVVSGVVSGSARADDVVSIDVAGVNYTAVVGADNTFKAMVKTSDLDKDDDSLVIASLATQDLAGNAITVQDTERFVNANRMSKELVFTRPSTAEPTNIDHTSPDNDMAYFIKYLNSHKMETKPFSIPVGGYATEPAIVKYHFVTPDDYHVLKERYTRGVQGEVNADLSTLKPYTEAMKNIVRKAYDEYASYANIKFIEVDDPLDADTNLFSANLTGVHSGSSAYAFLGGNIWWSNGYANVQSGYSPFAYYTALHEIGHTLNMRHTHDNFKGDYLPEDSLEFSVLSYKPYMNYSMYLNMGGLRMYDLAHIHRQFGVNPNARSGDNVYTFKNYNTVLGDGDRYIWDGNGVDTFMRPTKPKA